jgi:hypothetical protein
VGVTRALADVAFPHPALRADLPRKREKVRRDNFRGIQHPLQMLGIPSPSSLPFSLTVAWADARRGLDAATRVRLIFTARCTGSAR